MTRLKQQQSQKKNAKAFKIFTATNVGTRQRLSASHANPNLEKNSYMHPSFFYFNPLSPAFGLSMQEASRERRSKKKRTENLSPFVICRLNSNRLYLQTAAGGCRSLLYKDLFTGLRYRAYVCLSRATARVRATTARERKVKKERDGGGRWTLPVRLRSNRSRSRSRNRVGFEETCVSSALIHS